MPLRFAALTSAPAASSSSHELAIVGAHRPVQRRRAIGLSARQLGLAA